MAKQMTFFLCWTSSGSVITGRNGKKMCEKVGKNGFTKRGIKFFLPFLAVSNPSSLQNLCFLLCIPLSFHYLCSMKRTFQHRVTVISVTWVLLLAAVALFFFWKRTSPAAVVAMLVLCVDVLVVERLIHTTYVFTDDGLLVVSHGRFSRPVVVPLAEVTRTSVRRSCYGLVRHVLVEYGSNRMVSVMTENDEAFMKEMYKRILCIEKR